MQIITTAKSHYTNVYEARGIWKLASRPADVQTTIDSPRPPVPHQYYQAPVRKNNSTHQPRVSVVYHLDHRLLSWQSVEYIVLIKAAICCPTRAVGSRGIYQFTCVTVDFSSHTMITLSCTSVTGVWGRKLKILTAFPSSLPSRNFQRLLCKYNNNNSKLLPTVLSSHIT